MKFTCVCQGGNVRSVGLAYALKYGHKQDALAVSWQANDKKTQAMLYKWADYIVVMQAIFIQYIPKRYLAKVRVVDVGEDRYGSAFHPELQNYLKAVTEDWSKRGFKI